jgi:4-hydroxybenzoate polyprenyltransferase
MTLIERLNVYERLTRLDRPIGILLLLWPGMWALWFAKHGFPDPDILIIFVVGTVLTRSAGCVVNDFADRDIDPHVKRTQQRPLAAREIGTGEALALAGFLFLLAFILVLQLNRLTVLLSFAGLLLAVSYPFTKRFFSWPQAYLGIAFGWAIPMAWAAQYGSLTPTTWAMLAANILWSIAYDTEYAMVDRDDDVRLPVKSTAILFGRFDVAAVMICQAGFLGIMAAVGWLHGLGVLYYAGIAAAVALVGYQYFLIRDRGRDGCFKAFMNNNWVGAVIWIGLALDLFFK